MRLGYAKKIRFFLSILLFQGLLMGMVTLDARAGMFRINMTDGTSIETPYYWEKGGEIRFEVPGVQSGSVGIPKGQVKSIQEVVSAREFDPKILMESSEGALDAERKKALLDVINTQIPPRPNTEEVTGQDGLNILLKQEGDKTDFKPEEIVRAPLFLLEGDFPALMRPEGSDYMLKMRKILSSTADLSAYDFTLTLFDKSGHIVQQKPCELRRLEVDSKLLKDLGIQGQLFSVIGTVRRDPEIKRYEITASRR